jgi:hypothetical protein
MKTTMAKQGRKVDFDEKAIMEMMGPGVIVSSRQSPQQVLEPPKEEEPPKGNPKPLVNQGVDLPENECSESAALEKIEPVKRKKQNAYDDTFLGLTRIKTRATLTVDMDTHRKLERVIRLVFSNEIPLSIFVDNILNHHLIKYKDEFEQRLANKPHELY